MIAFAPDGRTLIVACEGEASAERGAGAPDDPPGSISFVDLSRGVEDPSVVDVGFASFEARREELVERGLRIVTPGRTLAQDLEPEYVAVAPDGRFAFVTLQENNAIAVIDVPARTIVSIEPLGFRDCAREGMGFDAVDDGVAAPRPVPVLAMYQPDAIAALEEGGELLLATANEGEARAAPFDEAITLEQARLLAGGRAVEELPEGRLLVSCMRAPESCGGGFCAFGTRSVSLWRVDRAALGSGRPAISLAWDSGDAIERIVAERAPALFNAESRGSARVDARSSSKGPEPEGIAIGVVAGRRLLFVTLERTSGVVVVDVSNASAPSVVSFEHWRNPTADLSIDVDRNGVPDELALAGDLAPEGVLFIPANDSPDGRPLLVLTNEVSGTTTILRVGGR